MPSLEDLTTDMDSLEIAQTELKRYQRLLTSPKTNRGTAKVRDEGLRIAPLLWWDVKEHLDTASETNNKLRQYAVLGHVLPDPSEQLPPVDHAPGSESHPGVSDVNSDATPEEDDLCRPVLLNTKSPWSAFLCGSQGSGKSHTLSCMLESCLINDLDIGENPNPLAGLVLHYDGSRGSGVFEAAYLCSRVKTTVLVSASNYGNLKKQYKKMAAECGGEIEVKKLKISPTHLDTERVKTLMAVTKDGEILLYIQTLIKIIRDIAIESGGVGSFNYKWLRQELDAQLFTGQQNQPLKLRLDLLDSFLDIEPGPSPLKTLKPDIAESDSADSDSLDPGSSGSDSSKSNSSCSDTTSSPTTDWSPSPDCLIGAPNELLIVDLTDPVIDVDSACVLFDTCLSIFIAQTKACGKIIALDEAHNYLLSDNAAAKQFTGKLLKSIREQRHQGTRIVIATQEPTLDTALLDLCSVTMVHRCSSPAWFEVLKKHVAGLYVNRAGAADDGGNAKDELFRRIVELELGESLLFYPTAAVGVGHDGEVRRMGDGVVAFRTRERLIADGGRTRLADGA